MNDLVGEMDWESEEIPSHYELETIDQLQAISDPMRFRIILLLHEKAMTGADLARELLISRSRAHYYLKTLVDLKLVQFRGEKICNGIIGRYYRAIASYYSYARLAAIGREKSPGDPEGVKILKAISNFVLNSLEASRESVLKSDGLEKSYHSTFETCLSSEQYDLILEEFRSAYDHLVEMDQQNRLKKETFTGIPYRISLFLMPLPGKSQNEPDQQAPDL